MIERERFKFKTIALFLSPPDAKIGQAVEAIDGSYRGWKGTVVDVDGEWRTVEAERGESA